MPAAAKAREVKQTSLERELTQERNVPLGRGLLERHGPHPRDDKPSIVLMASPPSLVYVNDMH